MDPKEAVEFLSNGSLDTIVLIDSHGHAQLERDADENYTLENESAKGPLQLKSITCAVHPNDWADTLKYASASTSILPALGVHPWYLEDLPENWLEELERLLLEHPSAIVGEIGLCKMARFVRQHPEGKTVALEMQRDVFKVRMKAVVILFVNVKYHEALIYFFHRNNSFSQHASGGRYQCTVSINMEYLLVS